jgi:2-keto-4-pentenoate hydratase/2-oxohepta-3-ene-1,7-dioic acid hydratase in catechol pathway
VQNDTTGSMVHPVAKIIEYISAFSPLSPAISTSTTSPENINSGGVRFLPTPPGEPVMITSPGDVIPDPQQLAIKTWLNGREVQNDTTGSMVHPVAKNFNHIAGEHKQRRCAFFTDATRRTGDDHIAGRQRDSDPG